MLSARVSQIATRYAPEFEAPRYQFFSENKIIKAFKQFIDSKAPGPDGIKPILLKNLPLNFTRRLRKVLEASYFTGFTPTAWKEAEVIFIPKPGKDDYSLAASFRPISLMSFVFKGMERLVYWHLLDTALAERPLAFNQHGFRAGYSTETALTRVVSKLESSVYRGGTAVAVFLDVQGAFDNVDPEKALAAMAKRGFPMEMVDWYTSYLTTRLTTLCYKGLSLTRRTTRGVPQGGILSPLMWNVLFDEFLQLFHGGLVECEGYADDAALLISGHSLQFSLIQLQIALDKATEWAESVGLSLSPSKSLAVIYTRKSFQAHGPIIRFVLGFSPFSLNEKLDIWESF